MNKYFINAICKIMSFWLKYSLFNQHKIRISSNFQQFNNKYSSRRQDFDTPSHYSPILSMMSESHQINRYLRSSANLEPPHSLIPFLFTASFLTDDQKITPYYQVCLSKTDSTTRIYIIVTLSYSETYCA